MFKEIIKGLGLIKDFSNAKTWYGKRWFTSKVLWANVLALAALVLQNHYGFLLSTEEQVSILAVVNIMLRPFTTQPIVATEAKIVDMSCADDGGSKPYELPESPKSDGG